MKIFGRRQSEIVDRIEIRGGAAFRARTREALELLRLSASFGAARDRIAVIRQGRRSGMKAWAVKPTFTVGKATWRHSAVWYAGAIAHDAYHAKLYCDAKGGKRGEEPDNDAWTGVEAEKQCLAFQRQVLLELNADEKIIDYIDRCAQNPTYQGHTSGWRSWLSYLLRWW
ncbi:MAG: hypothetical protein Q8S00_00345 [Deltaproteobacteria bacterium]|nr:hypothetical protein [Deltaproteobacteria bacterium]MDZ4347821.1 hypothetical protein [Candidatus Binatia bacterium]